MEKIEKDKKRYQNGKIYCIRSNQTDDIYIGSTINTLPKRLYEHKSNFKKWIDDNINHNYTTSFEIIKFDDCYIELIENYPCSNKNELERQEGIYIRNTDCVNKVIAGRTQKEYYIDNKDMILQNQKEYNIQNKDVISQYQKEYYIDNRDKLLQNQKEYQKEYNIQNKDVISQYEKEYYIQNKDKLLQNQKEYNIQNKDVISQYKKEYYIQNKDVISQTRKKYYIQNKDKLLQYQKEYNQTKKLELLNNPSSSSSPSSS